MEKKLLISPIQRIHQYKIDVLNYMIEQGTSIRETAAIFNIPSPSTIYQWKK